jgi:hypothetical protein
MECDFNLLSYVLFKIPKNIIILKALLSIFLKKNCDIFYMFYNIMIWNWKWKKMLLSMSSKYSHFELVFSYTKKVLWKRTLICPNCDTLVWFHPWTIDTSLSSSTNLHHIKLAYNVHQCYHKFHAKGFHAKHAKVMETKRLILRANH